MADIWAKLAQEQADLQAQAMVDSAALDLIAEGLRTPEWSVSFLEDIAEIVAKTGRDVTSPNPDPDTQDWRSH